MIDTLESMEEELQQTRNKQRQFELLAELAWKTTATRPTKTFQYSTRAVELAGHMRMEPPGLQRCLALAASGFITFGNLDKAKSLLERAQQLARQREDDRCRELLLRVEAELHMQNGTPLSALRCADAAIELARGNGFDTLSARLMRVRFCAYFGMTDEALVECLELVEKVKHKEPTGTVARVYSLLGEVYHKLLDAHNTRLWLNKAAETYRQLDHAYGEASCLRSLGIIAAAENKAQEAIGYFHRAIGLLQALPESPAIKATIFGSLAMAYSKCKNAGKAEWALRCADENARKANAPYNIAELHGFKGQLLFDREQYDAAIRELELALRVVRELDFPHFKWQIQKLLASSYERIDSHKEALAYEKMATAAEEQLYGHKMQQKVARIAAQFELRQIRAEQEIERRSRQELESRGEELHRNLNAMLLNLHQRQKGLLKLKSEVETMLDKGKGQHLQLGRQLLAEIEEQLRDSNVRNDLQRQVEQTHGAFIRTLRRHAADLTPAEIELCTLLRLNQSSQAIADLLYLSVNTVNTHRRRIRKKLGLERNDNLVTFLATLQD